MQTQYILLYPITEAEFQFSLSELSDALEEAGADCIYAGDAIFAIAQNPEILKRIRTEHNIEGNIYHIHSQVI